MNKPDLQVIQQWMTEVLVSPGSLPEKLERAAQRHAWRADGLIVSSPHLPAAKRLNIYATGYVLRLLECLRADFSVLQQYLGESLFDTFAKAYLIQAPSQSYTLFDLGAHFADFLERTRPPASRLPKEQQYLLDAPSDLARLERLRLESSRSQGIEGMPQAGQEVMFGMFQAEHRVEATPCLRLTTTRMPLVGYMERMERGEPAEIPPPETRWVVVGRAHYRVTLHEVPAWQWHFLQACTDSLTVAEAVDRVAEQTDVPASQLLADLWVWLPQAASLGWVRW